MPSLMKVARALSLGVLPLLLLAPAAHATYPGENGRVFYVERNFGHQSIASICPVGGGHYKSVATDATFPAPSPDGKRIAYEKLTGGGSTLGIYVANADGSGAVQITDGSRHAEAPSWSPDGKKLTFRMQVDYPGVSSREQPVVADVATKTITPLLSDPTIDTGFLTLPSAWTSDGQAIWFLASTSGSGSDIYTVPAGGGPATRIWGDDADRPFYQDIDFAPDGQTFLSSKIVTADPTDRSHENWRYPTAGGPGTKISVGDPAGAGSGDQILRNSPDGTLLIMQRGGSSTLTITDLYGQNAGTLGNTQGELPAWSSNTDDCTDPGASTIKINEVALGGAPFVELLDAADEAFPTAQGPYKLVAYDGAGARVGSHTISSTLLQNRDNTVPLLLSSPAADTAYGVTGDEPLGFDLPSGAGQACFTKGAGETKIDCVTWGCIATAVSKTSTPIPLAPAGNSSQRQGVGSTTFQVAAPTPKATNVAGTAGVSCPAAGGGQTGEPTNPGGPSGPSGGAGAGSGGSTGGGAAAGGAPGGAAPPSAAASQSGAPRPAFGVALSKGLKASSLAKGWTITLSGAGTGKAQAKLTVAGKTVATGSAKLKNGAAKLTLKATKAAKARLTKLRKKAATLTVSVGPRSVTQQVTLG